MIKVNDEHIREFANSPAWSQIMEPLIINQVECAESALENADTSHNALACKEVWVALRRLQASINIFKE